jgi:hypothetical protein
MLIKITMKQVRKERQRAMVELLNCWYRFEEQQDPKFRCFLHLLAER